MRKFKNGIYTSVYAVDEKGAGGANHTYRVLKNTQELGAEETSILTTIEFQNGPIFENGVNGVQNEDLIAIVIDRLQGFQSGNFSCRENAIAITKLEEALLWLDKRTNDRIKRGVEGKSVV